MIIALESPASARCAKWFIDCRQRPRRFAVLKLLVDRQRIRQVLIEGSGIAGFNLFLVHQRLSGEFVKERRFTGFKGCCREELAMFEGLIHRKF